MIDGIKYELKEISDITNKDLSQGIKKVVEKAKNQSENIILDLTKQTGATFDIAKNAVDRSFGAMPGVQSIRIIGEGFDQTFTNPNYINSSNFIK